MSSELEVDRRFLAGIASVVLRAYSAFVLCWDLLSAIYGCIMAILESVSHMIKPPPQKSIAGETALVIGSTRGVGRELVLQLEELGARVVCWDINIEGNPPKVPASNSRNSRVVSYVCDVSNREQVISLGARVLREVGAITMVFHCCGLPSPRAITERDVPTVEETISKAVLSHFWVMEAFLPQMLRANHGHFVALTSVAGLTGIRNQVPLCASQFAVQGIMEAMRQELRVMKATHIYMTLVHIYPFLAGDLVRSTDLRMRIPSYFGTIEPRAAAKSIMVGVRQNYAELSIPPYLLFLGHLVRILPRKASDMLRQLFDTGVDFC